MTNVGKETTSRLTFNQTALVININKFLTVVVTFLLAHILVLIVWCCNELGFSLARGTFIWPFGRVDFKSWAGCHFAMLSVFVLFVFFKRVGIAFNDVFFAFSLYELNNYRSIFLSVIFNSLFNVIKIHIGRHSVSVTRLLLVIFASCTKGLP